MQKEMKRFQIDVSPAQAERYDALVEVCELGTRRELFNASMTLFNWAVSEVRKGRTIASYDEASDRVEKIIHPALENAAAGKHARMLSETFRTVASAPADPEAAERARLAVADAERSRDSSEDARKRAQSRKAHTSPI